MKILSLRNFKTDKGAEAGYLTATLQLLPHSLSGHNVCPGASPDCIRSCNAFSGNGALFDNVTQSRLRKTKLVMEKRNIADKHIFSDVASLVLKAEKKNLTPVVRLNCFSDLDFSELIKEITEEFPTVIFYDYTKVFDRLEHRPANYHLTFSWSGRNEAACREALKLGVNVAVVFKELPQTFIGFPVIDGDKTDLRFLDPTPSIVGLKYKRNRQVNKKLEFRKWVEPSEPFVVR